MNGVTVRLKHGREKSVLHGHPWVFSGAVAAVEGDATGPVPAEVTAANGEWLARGLYHPRAALAVRLYSRREEEPLDEALFLARLDRALELRRRLFGDAGTQERTNAWRLVFSESDGLSGLTVDRYGDWLSVEVEAAGLVPFVGGILGRLREATGVANVFVRPDEDAVEREGLDAGAAPFTQGGAAVARIRENGLLFDVDVGGGQKTGFFLDQRANRQRVAAYARGRRVLSGYCYTGAFEVCAAAAGASAIVGLDRSESALARAQEHHRLNGTSIGVEYRKGDVPELLRRYRDAGQTFDMIILDPPRFVSSRAQVDKGLRAYKDINLLAMKLLAPGGVLATFSCSGQVSAEDFKRVIGWAAVDAGRAVRILETLGQPPDHPVLAVFPEAEYLKGLICWVE